MRIAAKKNSIKIISAIVICVIVLCAIVLIGEFASIANQRNKQAKLQASSSQLEEQIKEYDELIDYSSYDYVNGEKVVGDNRQQFLEDYARENLNWGSSDRKYFVQK